MKTLGVNDCILPSTQSQDSNVSTNAAKQCVVSWRVKVEGATVTERDCTTDRGVVKAIQSNHSHRSA
jgi:hypothetical protein